MRIGVIGGGTMGSAFVKSLCRAQALKPDDVLVIEHNELRRSALDQETHCLTAAQADKSLSACEVVVLSVKPQDFVATAVQIKEFLRPGSLIVSFMAGVKIETIKRCLAQSCVVRVMPNLPFSIQMGMSVYRVSDETSSEMAETASFLLNSCGMSLEVKEEELLDSATAISGTGPGYVFYFIEHLLEAARSLGFSDDQAKLLIGQTLVGSIELWRRGEHPAEKLRQMVTSKNGTTAAALEVFEQGKLGQVMISGIERAGERARELARLTEEER